MNVHGYASWLEPGHLGGNAGPMRVKRMSPHSTSLKYVKPHSTSLKYVKPHKPTTVRASTISNAREYIRTKMMKINAIFKNPQRNFIVTVSNHKPQSRSQSHTSRNGNRNGNRTRKTRASI